MKIQGAFPQEDLAHVCGLMFHAAAEGLLVVDGQGVIRLINPRLLEMFGYTEDELIGHSLQVLIPRESAGHHDDLRKKYMASPTTRPMGSGRELHGKRKNGELFPVEVSLNHFKVHDATFVMGLVTDITVRKHAEDELRRTNAELEVRVEQRTRELREAEQNVRNALEKERELNALKSRFVSMASHEFRTPLSTILSSVELIGRYNSEAGNDKVHKHVHRIRDKVRELTGILNDFLSLDKLEEGLVDRDPAEFDIVHLCIDVIEEMRGLAKPGQELNYDHDGEVRTLLQDRQLLRPVLMNLLNNAIKYSPASSRIELITHTHDGRLEIIVKDQGIGIPEADRAHLFERFFRAGNVVNIQGTGLGLHIVRKYLDLMHGSISLQSNDGPGTTFVIDLPQRATP